MTRRRSNGARRDHISTIIAASPVAQGFALIGSPIMVRRIWGSVGTICALAALMIAGRATSQPPFGPPSADRIGAVAGTPATTTPDRVVRIAWSRTDVAVSVDRMSLKPFAGLGSWAAFAPSPHGAMVMGDTVVFEDEVSPAMDAAFAHGLEVTGLHNHFFFDEPKAYFMHIGGTGDPDQLAAGVKAVWDAIKQVRAATPKPAKRFAGPTPVAGTVTAGPIEAALGHHCESKDGVV